MTHLHPEVQVGKIVRKTVACPGNTWGGSVYVISGLWPVRRSHSQWPCLFSPQMMNRCQRSDRQQWTSFCSNLKSSWSGTGRVEETDRETDQWAHHQLRTCLLPPLGSPSSSPSPALKHHRGLNDPACKKILWRRDGGQRWWQNAWHFGRKKKRLEKSNRCRGGRPGHKHTKPQRCCC